LRGYKAALCGGEPSQYHRSDDVRSSM